MYKKKEKYQDKISCKNIQTVPYFFENVKIVLVKPASQSWAGECMYKNNYIFFSRYVYGIIYFHCFLW